ncbi:MAG: glycosyltransferase [Candidatus Omnitrophica bacterium]|nr:glycosyltransferase [Candidatus Omnitrophota bacterium]
MGELVQAFGMRAQEPCIELSVVMPAYNEGERLAGNITETVKVLRGMGMSFEVVVVDDGSGDETWRLLGEMRGRIPELVAIRQGMNLGKGQALKKGFWNSRGGLIAFLDADLDVHPSQLKVLMDRMRDTESHVVIGSKRHPQSVLRYPLYRKVLSTVYFWLVKSLFGLPIRDTQTGLKLFRREVLAQVFPKVLIKKFAYDLELLVIAHHFGFKVAEAPVKIDFKRRFGRIGLRTILDITWDTLAVFYRLTILRYYDHKEWAPWPPDKAPLISVLVPVKGWGTYLAQCLAQCQFLEYPCFEVIVLPDQEVKEGPEWVHDKRIRFVPTGPVNPGRKRDIGAREANGQILAFLDSDAYPTPEWLTLATRHFQNPLVAAVGGPGVTPEEDSLLQKVSGLIYESPLGGGPASFRYTPGTLREVDDFPSCNLLVRRADFEAVRGFNSDFWPGEDTVLCRDLVHRLSKKIVYEPKAVVFHHRRSLFRGHLSQVRQYAYHRGYFAKRFPETSRKAAFFIPSLFVLFAASGLFLAFLLPPLMPLWNAGIAIYLGATVLAAVPTRRIKMGALFWMGLVLTHFTYGIFFLIGLTAKGVTR